MSREKDTRPAAERVRAAHKAIEAAQDLVRQAARNLCSVRGLAAEWDTLAALSRQLDEVDYAIGVRVGALSAEGPLEVA